jgi:DNA-directed RNA polymerase III subunit RPC2
LTQKTRTTITYKNDKFYLKQNSFSEDIPIVVIFKAMGMECDQEVAQMVGTDVKYLDKLALSI